MKVSKKIKVTLNDVLLVTQKGFERMDTKFGEVDERFNKIDKRFDKIENILLRNQDNRLDKLEDDVRMIKTVIGK